MIVVLAGSDDEYAPPHHGVQSSAVREGPDARQTPTADAERWTLVCAQPRTARRGAAPSGPASGVHPSRVRRSARRGQRQTPRDRTTGLALRPSRPRATPWRRARSQGGPPERSAREHRRRDAAAYPDGGPTHRDSLNPVAELDASGNLVAQYVYATKPNVPDYVIKWPGGVRTVYRILSDHLGSPLLAVDVATGEVAFEAEYGPFGQRTLLSPPDTEDWMPFGFAGGLYDQDTGLVRLGARDYDPMTGRWTTKDPIKFQGGQANLYVYVGGDPVNGIDPYGLSANCDLMCQLSVARNTLLCIHMAQICGTVGIGACLARDAVQRAFCYELCHPGNFSPIPGSDDPGPQTGSMGQGNQPSSGGGGGGTTGW